MTMTWIAVGGLGLFLLGYLMGRLSAGAGASRDLSGPPSPERTAEVRAIFAQLEPASRAAIEDALLRRRKIEAIKIMREASGLGLKESKEAIEALERIPPQH